MAATRVATWKPGASTARTSPRAIVRRLLLGGGLAVALAGTVVAPAAAQEIVVVEADRPIDAVGPALPLVEPHVRVDPRDPSHIVIGAIAAAPERTGPWHCVAYSSFDGGGRWSRSDFEMERCIDPWVTFLSGDTVLVTGIELLAGVDGGDRFRLVGFRSGDGGRRWTAAPQVIGRSFDHPIFHATVEDDGGRAVYVASRRMRTAASGRPRHTLWIARSRDGGRSFDELAELRPGNTSLIATGVGVLSDGAIVAGFWSSQRNVDGFGGEGMLARALTWVYRSDDGGRSFSAPLFVTDACASGVERAFPGYPYLAADTSGSPYADRLYLACVRVGLHGIAVARSEDGGEIWSDPVRVDAGRPGAGHARTPMLAVNRDGVVGVAWYDRSHDPDRACQHTYFTASADGGETFLEPVRVSTAESCPATPENGRVARSWSMGGDYSSLTAGPDGAFHLVWADSRAGPFALRRARIAVQRDD